MSSIARVFLIIEFNFSIVSLFFFTPTSIFFSSRQLSQNRNFLLQLLDLRFVRQQLFLQSNGVSQLISVSSSKRNQQPHFDPSQLVSFGHLLQFASHVEHFRLRRIQLCAKRIVLVQQLLHQLRIAGTRSRRCTARRISARRRRQRRVLQRRFRIQSLNPIVLFLNTRTRFNCNEHSTRFFPPLYLIPTLRQH
jgi:hypothetical protein